MTFGIGGYRLGNGRIHLQLTKNLNKAANKLEQAGYYTVNKTIPVETARNILSTLGIKASKAIEILPKTGDLDYFAAHGSAQISQDGKQIYTMVESLRRPISAFIKSLF